MKLSLILIPTLALIVGLSLSISNVAALTIANNTDFSINVLDNWAYRQPASNPLTDVLAKVLGVSDSSPLTLVPIDFPDFLVNTNQDLSVALTHRGAYSTMAADSDYPYRNVPVNIYAEYQINLATAPNVMIFPKENSTIGGEPAVKVHRTTRANLTNVEVVDYYVIHHSKPYIIKYAANVKDFQKYLPQFEQMVKTFKFIK